MSQLPLLLLLDEHSAHYQPDVVCYASDSNIIMLCLPPHATHDTQPFDCNVFFLPKTYWTTVCHDYTFKRILVKSYNLKLGHMHSISYLDFRHM